MNTEQKVKEIIIKYLNDTYQYETIHNFNQWITTSEVQKIINELHGMSGDDMDKLKNQKKILGESLEKSFEEISRLKNEARNSNSINELLRSFYQICERRGQDTNWEAITNKVYNILQDQSDESAPPADMLDEDGIEEIWQEVMYDIGKWRDENPNGGNEYQVIEALKKSFNITNKID